MTKLSFMLDVRCLLFLRDLAEHGTITAVAEAHQVTPSAVSQRLKQLEADTGVALLHRERRTVRLTAAGRGLAADTEAVLAALEAARTRLQELSPTPSGPVGVRCFSSALDALAAPLVRALRARHPGLAPAVTEDEPGPALAALRHHLADLAVVYRYPHLGTPAPAWAETFPLFTDPLLAVLPAEHPAVGPGPGDAVALRRLADADWITAPEGSACRDVALYACRRAGFTPRTRHTCASFAGALSLAGAGAGVTLVPRLATRALPAGLVARPLDVPDILRTVEAVVRRGTAGHPAVDACLTELRALAPPAPGR